MGNCKNDPCTDRPTGNEEYGGIPQAKTWTWLLTQIMKLYGNLLRAMKISKCFNYYPIIARTEPMFPFQ